MPLTVLIEHSPELVLDSTFQGMTELREIAHETGRRDAPVFGMYREDDLPAIGRGIVDPDVVRYIGPSDSAREVLDLNRSRWAERSGATFSICDQKDACLGHVWVNLEDSKRGSVGYWLLPEARGKGFATRSVWMIS